MEGDQKGSSSAPPPPPKGRRNEPERSPVGSRNEPGRLRLGKGEPRPMKRGRRLGSASSYARRGRSQGYRVEAERGGRLCERCFVPLGSPRHGVIDFVQSKRANNLLSTNQTSGLSPSSSRTLARVNVTFRDAATKRRSKHASSLHLVLEEHIRTSKKAVKAAPKRLVKLERVPAIGTEANVRQAGPCLRTRHAREGRIRDKHLVLRKELTIDPCVSVNHAVSSTARLRAGCFPWFPTHGHGQVGGRRCRCAFQSSTVSHRQWFLAVHPSVRSGCGSSSH